MLRFLKTLSIIFITITLLFLGLLFFITKYYNKEIQNIALQQINQQLKQPIDAETIRLNAFSQFPSITLEFNNFKIKDPLNPTDTLIFSEKGFLNFDINDIINKKYNVKKLILSHGFTKISVDRQGAENYLIFKKSKDSLDKNFNFKLTQVEIKDFKIIYNNFVLEQDLNLHIQNSKLKGAFSEKEYELDVFSNLLINQFLIEGVNYVKSKKAQLETQLKITNNPFSLTIKLGKLRLERMNFNINGFYSKGDKDLVDLNLKGNKIEISEIFSVLPNVKLDLSTNYSSRGILNFNGNLKGILNNNKKLSFSVDFNTENAFLKSPKTNLKFENINLKGNFKSQSQILNINQFSTIIDSQLISGSVKISNFKNPKYLININGKVDLEKIPNLLKVDSLNLNGIAEFDLNSSLEIKDDSLIIKKLAGGLNSQNMIIDNPNYEIQLQNILIDFPKDQMKINIEKGVLNNDTFSISANWGNWKEVIFSSNKNIYINYSAKIQQLYLDHFLNSITIKDSSEYKYYLNGSISAKKIFYEDLTFENILIDKILYNDNIFIEDLTASGFGGEINCNLVNIEFENRKSNMKINGGIKDLNIPKTMLVFNDFDQDLILNKHITGFVSSEFNLNLIIDEKGELDFINSSIYSHNKFNEISLINYPFLKEIVSYFQSNIITRNIVDINYYNNEIDYIKFHDFSSSVNMTNGIINFPKTNLKNDLLNFTFFGNYQLDNIVDYHLNFNWSDLKKKNQSSSQIVQEKQTKGKQLYFKISGPIDNLKYELDKEEIKNERKKKISSEKQIIKEIIRGEVEIKEKEEDQNFEIEWEEDSIVKKVEKNKDSKNMKIKKKDSSKLNKFLKKLGVEEEQKEKPKFEIDQ